MKILFPILFLFSFGLSQGQNRLTDNNAIGWCAYNGTFTVSERFSLHTEYQWRRDDYVKNWQQGLLRVGVNYKLTPETLVRIGYAWAETYPSGDIPINSYGKTFTEHRAFEMVQLSNTIEKLNISHRFMLEQRWIGRYSSAALDSEDSFVFSNRLRYMLRLQLPVYKQLYVAAYDEIFCGFGKNIGENIFDQNRFGALAGYQFSKNVRIEGGYLNQIVQLGREIGGKNAFQKNSGFIVSGIFNFDLQKAKMTTN